MAFIVILTAGISTEDRKEELEGDVGGVTYGDKAFPTSTEKILCILNTVNTKSVDHSQVLLPWVFPVFTEGDMPSMSDLKLTDQNAISNINCLKVLNCADNTTYNHSLHVLYASTFISLWWKGSIVISFLVL